jgi:UDP-glucose:(heptosyl)LPS alpha-1,3-glucosyltransferase
MVFHEFFARVAPDLRFGKIPLRKWYLLLHRRLYYRLVMFLENRAYRNPEVQLVGVSSLVAKQLKVHFGRSDVVVIPNGVDTKRFSPEERLARRATARKRFDYSESDFVLLLIGNDWKKKGLDFLMGAIALLSDLPVRVLVVGSDDPAIYRQALHDMGLNQQVRFESLSGEVLAFYGAADVYVGPSLEDAFGLPIVEAMACGLPVVASIHAGASEYVDDAKTGFLLSEPRDSAEIARIVRKLYTEDSEREKIGLAAAQYMRANCDWDQNAARTREFLEGVFRDRKCR